MMNVNIVSTTDVLAVGLRQCNYVTTTSFGNIFTLVSCLHRYALMHLTYLTTLTLHVSA